MTLNRHGFVLLPGLSLLALGGALDALAGANEVLEESAYTSVTVSLDGRPVRANCGTAPPHETAADAQPREVNA